MNPDGSTTHLNKALYGLKQAGVEWEKTLNDHILKRAMWRQSEYDSCLFFASEGGGGGTKLVVIAVYVDDLFITGPWKKEATGIQDHLLQKFEGKVDENPKSYLGLQMDRDETGVSLHQREYCKYIMNMVFQTSNR